ncbi:hypothetical protein GCM10011491_46480 [Brucella endophytica]|uniref:Uncharacterized protein n=1 Tax=Brucella endophytica TaxID=1963359 RepID=A0A916SRL2_9HYPH|nr:hypothetical protein GCM10011491_46480 [Brucella endophytica]
MVNQPHAAPAAAGPGAHASITPYELGGPACFRNELTALKNEANAAAAAGTGIVQAPAIAALAAYRVSASCRFIIGPARGFDKSRAAAAARCIAPSTALRSFTTD